jgi:hypothetical protein
LPLSAVEDPPRCRVGHGGWTTRPGRLMAASLGQGANSRHSGRPPSHAPARISAEACPGHCCTLERPPAPPVCASTSHRSPSVRMYTSRRPPRVRFPFHQWRSTLTCPPYSTPSQRRTRVEAEQPSLTAVVRGCTSVDPVHCASLSVPPPSARHDRWPCSRRTGLGLCVGVVSRAVGMVGVAHPTSASAVPLTAGRRRQRECSPRPVAPGTVRRAGPPEPWSDVCDRTDMAP